MKKNIFSVVACLLFSFLCLGQVKYVTTSGSSLNSGDSENQSWSISHAFSVATPGMTINIKSGVYSGQNLVVGNSGTSSNRIRFIGYNNTLGDIVTIDGQGSSFVYGDIANGSSVPLIRENRQNNNGQGVGMTNTRSYIDFENLHFQYYLIGVKNSGNHTTMKNIISSDAGNFNASQVQNDPFGTGPTGGYRGQGMFLGGDNASGIVTALKVVNCLIINAGAEGVRFQHMVGNSSIDSNKVISGNNVYMSGNRVYGDDNANPTDYHYYLGNGAVSTWHDNIYVERVGTAFNEPKHEGHGIVLKANESDNTGNIISNFEVQNTYLEMQFPRVFGNLAINGTLIRGNDWDVDNGADTGGINLKNGSYANEFENIFMRNTSVYFKDQTDGLSGDVADSSNGNTFRNLISENYTSTSAHIVLNATNHTISSVSADNNKFINCTFYGGNALVRNTNRSTNTSFDNCLIVNITQFKRNNGATEYPFSGTFDRVNQHGSSWDLSNEPGQIVTNRTSLNPVFLGAGENGDKYKISNSSGIKDLGKNILGSTRDFGGYIYKNNPPIGAWEYGGSSLGSENGSSPFFGFAVN